MTSGPPPGIFHTDMASVLAASMAPTQPLPKGAWDCHAHIFGPVDAFPIPDGLAYQPPISPADEYVHMLDCVGFSHGVIVQPAVYGYNNAALLDGLTRYPNRLRGVAVVAPDTSEDEFQQMHAAGVRGVRVTEPIGGRSVLGTELLRMDHLEHIAPKLARADMHIQLWADARTIAGNADRLARLPVPVVFDHFGQIDAADGVTGDSFQTILNLFKHPHIWAKVQLIRVAQRREDRAKVRPFFDALLDAAPDRLFWGTDWPFIALGHALPNPGSLLDEFAEWTDLQMSEAILVNNPARLYR